MHIIYCIKISFTDEHETIKVPLHTDYNNVMLRVYMTNHKNYNPEIDKTLSIHQKLKMLQKPLSNYSMDKSSIIGKYWMLKYFLKI